MDARPARQRNRGQSVRWQKLDFDGGQFAGSGASGRRGKFTVKKHKQTNNKKNMNKQTQATGHDVGQLAEDARALMAAFFQAEDDIRDYKVTGVQTCALPIWKSTPTRTPSSVSSSGDSSAACAPS